MCAVLSQTCYRVRSRVMVAHAGHVKTMATDQWAHLVLITALSRVDDTALLRKHVISDLQASSSCCPPQGQPLLIFVSNELYDDNTDGRTEPLMTRRTCALMAHLRASSLSIVKDKTQQIKHSHLHKLVSCRLAALQPPDGTSPPHWCIKVPTL